MLRSLAQGFLYTSCVLFSLFSFSQTPLDSNSVYDLNLDELMGLKSTGEYPSELESLINSLLDVTSVKPLTATSSPNIISYITEEEIQKSGARDLVDVLRLVPGFDFGVDVQNAIGLGIRGNWANEGKVLVMLDGQEMNEILYSTIQFGNRFPIDHIKKIEIIRGPGSSIYGGYAEYGVINIITYNGKDLKGGAVSGMYSTTSETYTHRNASLSLGYNKHDLDLSLNTFMGQGQRSDRMYYDGHDGEVSMVGKSNLNPSMINVGASYKNLSIRSIYENYKTKTPNAYGPIASRAYDNNFRNIFGEIKYKIAVLPQLTITPKFNFKSQRPWNLVSDIAEEDSLAAVAYDKIAQRYRGNITANWYISSRWDLTAGAEYFRDNAINRLENDTFSNGKTNISFANYASFFQLTGSTRIVNVIIGARYDYNNAYGAAFVPRVGITKKIKRFNGKILYAQSFRAPAIENVNLAYEGKILPEKSNNFECELGYQLSNLFYLNLSAFDITTNNPIIYFVDTLFQEGYTNLQKTGTRGIEFSVKSKTAKLFTDLSYSYYTTAGKNKVPDYETNNSSTVLAFPAHKATANIQYTMWRRLSISAQGILMGSRYGYDAESDSLGNLIMNKFNPVLLTNAYVQFANIVPGLTAGLGCYNILDSSFPFLQPYNGGHAPLPSYSRAYVAKLSYKLKK